MRRRCPASVAASPMSSNRGAGLSGYMPIRRDLWLRPEFKRLTVDGKIVYLHLLTAPTSNTFGLFIIGADQVALSCGVAQDVAATRMKDLESVGLIRYDSDRELVWVIGVVDFTVGVTMSITDKRWPALVALLDSLPDCEIKKSFVSRYRAAYSIGGKPPSKGASKGPSSPLGSKEHEKEKDHKKDHEGSPSSASDNSSSSIGKPIREGVGRAKSSRVARTRLPDDWKLPDPWLNWALMVANVASKLDWSESHIRMIGAKFRDHHLANGDTKADWRAAWQYWIRKDIDRAKVRAERTR